MNIINIHGFFHAIIPTFSPVVIKSMKKSQKILHKTVVGFNKVGAFFYCAQHSSGGEKFRDSKRIMYCSVSDYL